MQTYRTLDYDGSPHNADTGERAYGAGEGSGGHWIDDLPEASLAGVVIVSSPQDMVCAPNGKWMRRFEWDLEHARAVAAGRRLDATLSELSKSVETME